ncbi:hypothetical protein [Vibrio sp. Hal054]|uniref:hypothetical protein n=1 Tax=Vibrio sp. Hal054 TaxID=3035158 RepID=UPI00301B82DD
MDAVQVIEVNDIVESEIYQQHKRVIDGFWSMVAEFQSLLLADERCVCFIPISFGKDSKLVSLAGLEAYRSLIASGQLEASRPLIMITVDTVAESLPMIMYPHYCAPRLKDYARRHNINLHHQIISPSFYDEYANRYLGAQKIVPNAKMSGDCSAILKVDNTTKFIRNLRHFFRKSSDLLEYADSPIICATGQRIDEGARRSANMAKQNVSKKSLADLKAELQVSESSANTASMFNFAPIRDWSTDDVFLANELAGERPLTRNLLGIHNAIPSFLNDHALQLAIYGNAALEQCEIAVGSTAAQGCNAKSRYGCSICTMIGAKDKTQSSLATLERWNFLGQQELLRLRDFMYRLSIDTNNARALHAKAVDGVTYNRIALQNNILKPVYLEQLIRLFSQVTVLSQERAAAFNQAVKDGTVDSHPAILCITNDPTLNAKARRAFIAMYKEQATKPLIKLFSERHGAYLSFRWSLDGIQALPYAPLAIWNETVNDRSTWIEWPQTNEEYQSNHGSLLTNDRGNVLKDAIMMPLLDNFYEHPQRYLANPELHSISNLWSRERNAYDTAHDKDANCTVADYPIHVTPMTVHARVKVACSEEGYPIKVTISGDYASTVLTHLTIEHKELLKVMVNGRVANSVFSGHIESTQFDQLCAEQLLTFSTELGESLSKARFSTPEEALNAVQFAIDQRFKPSGVVKMKAFLKNYEIATLTTAYKANARMVSPSRHFTQRRLRKVSGRIEKTTTRLNFYPLVTDCRLALAHGDNVVLLRPNYTVEQRPILPTEQDVFFTEDELFSSQNLRITDTMIDQWRDVDGVKRALDAYYTQKAWLNVDATDDSGMHRHSTAARQYLGTNVADSMIVEGVIAIDKPYMPVYQQFKKRTDLFNSIGAFDVQSMSYDDIAALPWAVSMQQHRKDKALVLTELRKMRNAQRAYVRSHLEMDASSLDVAVSLFGELTATTSCDYIHYGMSHAFKSTFNTQSVSLDERCQTSLLWLKYYFKPLSDVQELIKSLFPSDESKQYAECLDSGVRVGTLVTKTFKQVADQIRQAQQAWTPLAEGLSSLIVKHQKQVDRLGLKTVGRDDYATFMDYHNATTHFEGEQFDELRSALLSEFKLLVQDLHPHVGVSMFEPNCDYWKPNVCILWSELLSMLQAWDEISTEVHLLLSSLDRLVQSAGTQYNSGALEQQLTFLSGCKVVASAKPSVACPPPAKSRDVSKSKVTMARVKGHRKIDHTALLLGL